MSKILGIVGVYLAISAVVFGIADYYWTGMALALLSGPTLSEGFSGSTNK